MFVALLAACAPVTPSAPLADAGAVVTGSPGEIYMFDASSTTGEALTFEWTIVDGPAAATLIDHDTMTPYLIPEVEGIYTLSLTACDRLGRCDLAETYALVGEVAQRRGAPSFSAVRFGGKPWGKNAAPVAEATASRSLGGLGTVKLNGGDSYDPDGDTLRYRWSFTARPAGSTLTDADIQDNTSALASFRADVTGSYTVRLVVRDGMLSDSVTLPGLVVGVVHDDDPLDDLGRAPGEVIGTPDGLSSAKRALPSSASSSSGRPRGKNAAPVAEATASRSLGGLGTVKLNGGDSYDPDGDTLRYRWSFTARPAGSTLTDADIQDNTSALASFKADVTGSYTVRLVVRDGMLSDSVTLPSLVVGVLSDDDPLDDLGRAPGAVRDVPEEMATSKRAQPSSALSMGGRPWGKNAAPVADATASRSLGGLGTVKLNGGDSYDPDGDTLRYRWSFTTRPAGSTLTDADIQDSTSALASFKADVTGTYAVRLVVRDGMLSDSVTLPGLIVGVLHDNDPLDDLGRAPGGLSEQMAEHATYE